MADWVGFTDEELKRLKGQSGAQKAGSSGCSPSLRGHVAQRGRSPKQRQLAQKVATSPQPPATDVQPSMLLSEPKQSTEKQHTNAMCKTEEKSKKDNTTTSNESTEQQDSKTDTIPDPEKVLGKELDEKQFVERELSNADKFQIQQKIMEEQNKKKQELLAVAIVERQKKAKAEASKLVRIQRELATLDRILHADVTIIRDKIEEASREFLEAQKRYERAEQEFVEAKMDLHSKSEIKESLTEHLYTIIHQNEIRKAKKLTELMEKLQLETDEEASPVHVDLSGLPSLTLLNAIHTLEPSSPPTSPPVNSNTQKQICTSPEGKVCQGEDSETKLTVESDKENAINKNSTSQVALVEGSHSNRDPPVGTINNTVKGENGSDTTAGVGGQNQTMENEPNKSDLVNVATRKPDVSNMTTELDSKAGECRDQNENLDSQLQI